MAVSFIEFLELNLLVTALHRSFIELPPERDGDDSVPLGVEDQYGTGDLLDPPVRVELHVEEGQEGVGESHARAGVEGGEGGVGEGVVGVGGEVNDLLGEVVVRRLQYETVHPVTVLRQSPRGHSRSHGVTPDHQPVRDSSSINMVKSMMMMMTMMIMMIMMILMMMMMIMIMIMIMMMIMENTRMTPTTTMKNMRRNTTLMTMI